MLQHAAQPDVCDGDGEPIDMDGRSARAVVGVAACSCGALSTLMFYADRVQWFSEHLRAVAWEQQNGLRDDRGYLVDPVPDPA